MSPTGIGLIAFVILLSGALAYTGDVLGRKLGKKRLTLFRIRPKHFAALMTATFGMAGSALAIGTLMIFAQPVRVMLLQGDQLKQELAQLRRSLDEKQGDLDKTKGMVTAEQKRVKVEQARLKLAQSDLTKLKSLTSQLKSQATSVRKDLASVKGQLASMRPKFAKLQEEYKSINTQKVTALNHYSEIVRQNIILDQQLRASEEKLISNKNQIAELSTTIKQLQEQLFSQSESANKQLKEQQNQIEETRRLLDRSKEDLESTNLEYQKLRGELDRLITGPTAVSRTQPLIFSRGDELVRVPVRTRLNSAEAKSTILGVIEGSSNFAESRGAKPSVKGGDAAVLGVMRDAKGNEISEATQIANYIEKLANRPVEQVVIAYAFFNAFSSEPVPLILQIRPNPVIYHPNQLIIETRIDGQLPEDRILEAINTFAQEKLGPKAIADGMIPAVGKNQPLGEISPDSVLALVSDIHRANRPIRVQFVALQETRAADRLKLKFVLK